ncbi:MAG: hypothetical protein AVDCRST_MAG56-732 [uncultured Cytophagales bacterium]|uniref:Uncharacterized protein n=1 Tax=uncultured Cytophagales bacterium TaxID=158755 RepID=A0A6J4HLL1_9SPHI|nr:MAG: hypothetical protein AVDCRST_MAG56-732 [uncultured Cytophagales bacterium]
MQDGSFSKLVRFPLVLRNAARFPAPGCPAGFGLVPENTGPAPS